MNNGFGGLRSKKLPYFSNIMQVKKCRLVYRINVIINSTPIFLALDEQLTISIILTINSIVSNDHEELSLFFFFNTTVQAIMPRRTSTRFERVIRTPKRF